MLIKWTCWVLQINLVLVFLIVFIFYVGSSICLEENVSVQCRFDSVKDFVEWWEKGCWFAVNRVIYWGLMWERNVFRWVFLKFDCNDGKNMMVCFWCIGFVVWTITNEIYRNWWSQSVESHTSHWGSCSNL